MLVGQHHVLRRALLILALVASGTLAAPNPGYAADPEQARDAYDRGLAAHQRGDLAAAAQAFGEADRLAPNDTALSAAIVDAIGADDMVLAMRLIERAEQRPQSGALASAVAEARPKVRPRVGRLRMGCIAQQACELTLDGAQIEASTWSWVLVGKHTAQARSGAQTVTREVTISADRDEDLQIEAVAPAPVPPPPSATAAPDRPAQVPAAQPKATATPAAPPPSPFASPWFWTAAGATAVLGGVTVWSALDTSSSHDDFVSAGCADQGSPACDSLASDGRKSDLRTNILGGAAVLSGAATVLIAVLPRGSERSPQPTVGVSTTSRSFAVRMWSTF